MNKHTGNDFHNDGGFYGNGQQMSASTPVHHGQQNWAQQQAMMPDQALQMQQQEQMIRSLQANKQQVYEVYGNCITMLEELECRELRQQGQQPLPRSDIHLPDQQQFDDQAIQRKLETQLLLFQMQLGSCYKEIKEEVTEKLNTHTYKWISQREESNIPYGSTDKYVGQLFEVLQKGQTQHPTVFYEQPRIGEAEMQKAMQAFVHGSHRLTGLDRAFKDDPDKQAVEPRTRAGKDIDKGIHRMGEVRPDLQPHDFEKQANVNLR